MGKRKFLWAFLWAIFALGITASHAVKAADPPPATNSNITPTYVPPSASSSPAVQKVLGANGQSPQASPGSATAPGGVPTIAVPTPDTLPAPSQTQTQSLGQYRNKNLEVNISKMFLNRYKQSVVRVTARDQAGNALVSAMGVGVGPNAEYIATPLSIVLGNSQQWADQIEISHQSGNKYNAKVALIDEEKNIVLLAPEANPAPLPFVRQKDERQQVSVYTISFEDAEEGTIEAKIHVSLLAAVNHQTGILSVSGSGINDEQAGTGIINSQGELVGMLLPGGKGVLASTLQRLVARAQKSTPMDPSMIGVILGRGVLVSPTKQEGAYTSISAALDAIKKGDAPKADPLRYTAAKDRNLAPKASDKVVVRVMPGHYKESKMISLPSNISLSGSGTDQTVITGSDPNKPVLLIQNAQNVILANFRIVPAPMQQLKAPAVIISKSRNVTVLGNLMEAKGGVALWVNESQQINIAGNAFPRGQSRAISCDKSEVEIRTNAFLGDWSYGIGVDKNCTAAISHNLFFENKNSISIFHPASRAKVEYNTFIRNTNAVKASGIKPTLTINDNLFYENTYGIYSDNDLNLKLVGRNASWKTKFQARGRQLTTLDLIRTEPEFENPAFFDFRIKPGKGQLGSAAQEKGKDLGAYQTTGYLGAATQQLIKALGTAIGEPELAAEWDFE